MKKYYVFLIVFLILVSVLVFQMYWSNWFDSINDFINFLITSISFMISLIALVIALNTYLSIDSVSNISKMEGNMLENEHYCVSYAELISDYDAIDVSLFSQKVFDKLEEKFLNKNNKTCVQFADNLQSLIDVMVFFPYMFDPKNPNYKQVVEKMDRLLITIKRKQKQMNELSQGDLILIDETIKLIDAVVAYQMIKVNGVKEVIFKIMEVRGEMIQNPITRTVYYDYLGLVYKLKANQLISENYNLDNRENVFSIKNIARIKSQRIDEIKNEQILFFYMKTMESFNNAYKNCLNNELWKCFILFNIARAEFTLNILPNDACEKEELYEWKDTMNHAIDCRYKLRLLHESLYNSTKESFMNKSIKTEEIQSRLIKLIYEMAISENITCTKGHVLYSAPNYHGIEEYSLVNDEVNVAYVSSLQHAVKKYLAERS